MWTYQLADSLWAADLDKTPLEVNVETSVEDRVDGGPG